VGNRLSLGDQETVGSETECRVVVEASPAPALVMTEPEFLLEVEIVAFDAPAQRNRPIVTAAL